MPLKAWIGVLLFLALTICPFNLHSVVNDTTFSSIPTTKIYACWIVTENRAGVLNCWSFEHTFIFIKCLMILKLEGRNGIKNSSLQLKDTFLV